MADDVAATSAMTWQVGPTLAMWRSRWQCDKAQYEVHDPRQTMIGGTSFGSVQMIGYRNEIKKIETKSWNLTVKGNVIASEPTRLQDAIRIDNNLMDKKLKGYDARNAENKRRFDNNTRDNRVPQPPFKRNNIGGKNVARAYTVGDGEKKGYVRSLPYCNKKHGHYKSDCPKLKNQNHGNKTGNNEARGRAYILGGGANEV
ncbi:hypothetical protein Tco_0786868 [Tanacetum coccineum]